MPRFIECEYFIEHEHRWTPMVVNLDRVEIARPDGGDQSKSRIWMPGDEGTGLLTNINWDTLCRQLNAERL